MFFLPLFSLLMVFLLYGMSGSRRTSLDRSGQVNQSGDQISCRKEKREETG